MHVFEYTMQSLRRQTFKDFEVVVADVYYDKRKDYFQKHPEDFPVIHVPVKPNIWIGLGYPAIAATKNTFLLYAKGEYVTNLGDCWLVYPRYLENILKHLKHHRYVSNRYAKYHGEDLLYVDKRATDSPIVVGNVTMHIEDWLDLNGYNELFDGSKGHEDRDLSYRIGLKDHGINQDTDDIDHIVVDPYIVRQNHISFPSFRKTLIRSHKCCLLNYKLMKQRIEYRANTVLLSDEELQYLSQCSIKPHPGCERYANTGKCLHSKSVGGKIMVGADKKMVSLCNHPSLYFGLREQRKNIKKTIGDLQKLTEEFYKSDD